MDNPNSRADQWLQHCEQYQIQEMSPCFNGVNVTLSSEYSLGDGGSSVAQEAVGRRCRASRRAIPTTLLNANPSNFRALVQKFTGRSSGGESNQRKGPLTLDFRSPTKVSREAIFPVVSSDQSNYGHDHALNCHVSNEHQHVTWSVTEETTTYQLAEETNSAVYHGGFDNHDHDLLKDYSGNSSSYDDGLDHLEYHHDFYLETATLEDFMMRDLDFII